MEDDRVAARRIHGGARRRTKEAPIARGNVDVCIE